MANAIALQGFSSGWPLSFFESLSITLLVHFPAFTPMALPHAKLLNRPPYKSLALVRRQAALTRWFARMRPNFQTRQSVVPVSRYSLVQRDRFQTASNDVRPTPSRSAVRSSFVYVGLGVGIRHASAQFARRRLKRINYLLSGSLCVNRTHKQSAPVSGAPCQTAKGL